jgi:hypothetical protein
VGGTQRKYGREPVLPGSLHNEVSIIGLLSELKQHVIKPIGCLAENQCLRPFAFLAIIFLLVLPKSPCICKPKNPSKVPPPAPSLLAQGRSPLSNRAYIPPHHKNTLQKYLQVLAHNIRRDAPALHRGSDHIMPPPLIDSTASAWFRIWAAALIPIATVLYIFRAAGFAEIEDRRFNPVSPTQPLISEI